MTAGTVSVADIDVGYTTAGDGPPVVLVHGLAEDRRSWQHQQDGLPGLRTVSYDLRGHGTTSLGSSADGSLAQLGADLAGVLEALTGPATCVGFSLGGTVVLEAAAHRPDLVMSAVVLGTSSVVGRTAAGYYADRIAVVESGDAAAMRTAVWQDTAAALVTTSVDVDAVVSARLAAIGSGAGYVNAARAMAGLRTEPLTDALGGIGCHVDVVGAEGDTFCPRRAAEILVDALPAADYHEIPGAGHLMNVDRPELVTELLQELVTRDRAR